jgi:cyclopropane fatty-acyl-phospholipid synthase-like methyltransferase
MADFRKALYDTYVSNFKRGQSTLSEPAARSHFAWCERRLWPLLTHLRSDAKVLELGCGPGYMLEYLRSKGMRDVLGVDLSDEQVAAARARGVPAVVGDIHDVLDQHPQSFDLIVALDLVEHFTKDELFALSARLINALRPGGTLLIQTPNGAGLMPGRLMHGDLTHCTIFTPQSLQQWLTQAGFEDFRFRETGPVAKNSVGALRCALWAAVRWIANGVRIVETGQGQALWTENMICTCRKPSQPSPFA